jgi:hypothetical protein
MSDLLNSVADGISDSDLPMSVSAVVTADSIGYPRRVVSEDGETHDGELKGFDEAYDYACSLFDVDEVDVEKDDQYIWFTT